MAKHMERDAFLEKVKDSSGAPWLSVWRADTGRRRHSIGRRACSGTRYHPDRAVALEANYAKRQPGVSQVECDVPCGLCPSSTREGLYRG